VIVYVNIFIKLLLPNLKRIYKLEHFFIFFLGRLPERRKKRIKFSYYMQLIGIENQLIKINND